MKKIIILFWLLCIVCGGEAQPLKMMYKDTTRLGVPFSKDPCVIRFKNKYLMYYSIPPYKNYPNNGWNIGIAESHDLIRWDKVGEITPAVGADYERKGMCAPGALVRNGIVHLFYQTYGNGRNDAICHAESYDGIHFQRDISNPVFRPTGDWNCGRAIDAEVYFFKGRYYLFFATRDKDFKVQMLGVAVASENTDFSRGSWRQVVKAPILKPDLDWEGLCIEAPSITKQGDKLFMFYAGAYNNEPQQIGVAESYDGLHWKRVFKKPFMPNGQPGAWNASESGHPDIFTDTDGQTYLFFQGNNDNGHTWFITNVKVLWKRGKPYWKK